jgi:hypothetical protein
MFKATEGNAVFLVSLVATLAAILTYNNVDTLPGLLAGVVWVVTYLAGIFVIVVNKEPVEDGPKQQ